FRVLKQARAPSVLVELGFLSNPAEEQQMSSARWQKRTAEALAAAVDAYFAGRRHMATSGSLRSQAGKLPP
ncbi:MAG: N-acetylmuramoyl-L-alanine amidase, partial [Gammaproteobacteria bacterium]